MKKLFVVGILFFIAMSFSLTASAAGDAAKGKASFAVCVACHGADGMGIKALNSPRIAGQEIWYLDRQLKNFKKGLRGSHQKDVYGMQMRPMALTLPDDQAIADISTYISSLQGKAVATTIAGDAKKGKQIFMVCQACHGPKGNGNKALNAPKLSGLQDWYVARQLKNFKAGIRGTKQGDVFGMQMRPMAMTLADDKAINDVTAYISTFK